MRITGTTNGGSKVVLYVHDQTSWNSPEKLRYAREHHKNGAGPFPSEEFYALIDRIGDGKVFLADYDALKKSTLGVISVDAALAHPQTIPFLGGEKIAEKYLAKHRKVYGDNIGIWHSDDLAKEPRGRLLFLGDDIDGDLNSLDNIISNARFFGVRRSEASVSELVSAKGAKAQKPVPSLEKVLEQVLVSSQRFVPDTVRDQYETALRRDLRKLYKA